MSRLSGRRHCCCFHFCLFILFFFCSFAVIVMSPVVSRKLRTCFFLLPTFVPFLALNEKQESHNKVSGNNKRPENSKLYVISLNLRLPLCWGSLSLSVSLFYLFVTCLFGLCRKIENLKQGFLGDKVPPHTRTHTCMWNVCCLVLCIFPFIVFDFIFIDCSSQI